MLLIVLLKCLLCTVSLGKSKRKRKIKGEIHLCFQWNFLVGLGQSPWKLLFWSFVSEIKKILHTCRQTDRQTDRQTWAFELQVWSIGDHDG